MKSRIVLALVAVVGALATGCGSSRSSHGSSNPDPDPTPTPHHTPTPTPNPTPNGTPTPAPTPPQVTYTDKLHGTVLVDGVPTAGVFVAAWGHNDQGYYTTTTDSLGIYVFTGLQPTVLYNVTANGHYDAGQFYRVDIHKSYSVHDNVALIAGPDGWHGEDFSLSTHFANRLHGTVLVNGVPQPGIAVSAWGKDHGDFHQTTTDSLGIYEFENLHDLSLYNVVVNAQYQVGQYVTLDEKYDYEVRNNVQLVAGPDAWHGENFDVALLLADRLHGTVHMGGAAIGGMQVTAWGHDGGDFHLTTTDGAGIYEFHGLNPYSRYNVVVNGDWNGGGFDPHDDAYGYRVRDNVDLTAGPDAWHGEDFDFAE